MYAHVEPFTDRPSYDIGKGCGHELGDVKVYVKHRFGKGWKLKCYTPTYGGDHGRSIIAAMERAQSIQHHDGERARVTVTKPFLATDRPELVHMLMVKDGRPAIGSSVDYIIYDTCDDSDVTKSARIDDTMRPILGELLLRVKIKGRWEVKAGEITTEKTYTGALLRMYSLMDIFRKGSLPAVLTVTKRIDDTSVQEDIFRYHSLIVDHDLVIDQILDRHLCGNGDRKGNDMKDTTTTTKKLDKTATAKYRINLWDITDIDWNDIDAIEITTSYNQAIGFATRFLLEHGGKASITDENGENISMLEPAIKITGKTEATMTEEDFKP